VIRWLGRIAAAAVLLILVVVAAGTAYEQLARRSAARDFQPQGKLVDIGGRRIQLDCRGNGTPIVVFEAGLDVFGSLSWAAVHDDIAKFSRACAYSRAGIMWSDPSDRPFSAANVAEDLHKTLAIAGEKPPYVMVGHSLGGPYVTVFTGRYGSDVAGLVFVDASHPDQLTRFRDAVGKDLSQDPQLELGATLSWSGLVRLVTVHNELPPGAPAWIGVTSHAWLPQSLAAANAEMENLAVTLEEAGKTLSFGDRPLFILTHGENFPPQALRAQGLNAEDGMRMDAVWNSLQNDEATWSTRSRHQIVRGAQHYIQFGKPKAVVDAVREVVDEVRTGAK
jgi:pimeloyl-ACP methyl ester carboxylesterase